MVSVELIPADGSATLPPFTAGAHIDLFLPNGSIRNYSLLNAETEDTRYVIGVYREPQSRGGSQYIHESLRVGQVLRISGPRNNFPLAPEGARHVLFAGGIGITPVLAMVRQLVATQRQWWLLYCAQTRGRAAFVGALNLLASRSRGELTMHFDDEHAGQPPSIDAEIARHPLDTHFYCCGPRGMLEAFKRACTGRPPHFVHFESFVADKVATSERGFTVILNRSGRRIAVPPGTSVLDALISHGVSVSYSCQQGVCGTCETRVLQGTPDHRDQILSEDERKNGQTMMICCSGSLSDELILDL